MISKAARLLFYAGILVFASCKLEPCKDYVCVNGLPLEDGKNCICLCDLGWDGTDCTVEDKCITNNVYCYPGRGYCNNNGDCVCSSGYEGDSCEILSREKFLDAGAMSSWTATDTCASLVYQYEIDIKAGSENRTLEIYNIRNLGSSQFITVYANRLIFEQRTDVLIGNIEIRDLKGTLSSTYSTLRITYKSDEVLTSNCQGTWIRQ